MQERRPLGEIGLVAGTFDPHAPLRADLIPLFRAGECGECQFDRHRCDGANQPFGNRPIERTMLHHMLGGETQAKLLEALYNTEGGAFACEQFEDRPNRALHLRSGSTLQSSA